MERSAAARWRFFRLVESVYTGSGTSKGAIVTLTLIETAACA